MIMTMDMKAANCSGTVQYTDMMRDENNVRETQTKCEGLLRHLLDKLSKKD